MSREKIRQDDFIIFVKHFHQIKFKSGPSHQDRLKQSKNDLGILIGGTSGADCPALLTGFYKMHQAEHGRSSDEVTVSLIVCPVKAFSK